MIRRPTVAALAVAALLASGCASEDSSDEASATRDAAATSAADWVLDELADNGLVESTTSYEGKTSTMVDHGASADLVLALGALGHAPEQAAAITEKLAAELPTYVGAGKEVYAGPSAKALTVALDQGRDPASFGGLDLVERVASTVATQGPLAGRVSDSSEYGDYANTLGQAYAAGSLTRAGHDLGESATDFLLAQQCEAGFFRLDLSDAKAADQSCDGAGDLGEQSPDVTALVVLQLAPAAAEDDEEVADALEAAGDWLEEQQAADGSFADPENGVNANSTGLAGWALRLLGEDDAADEAADWLRTLLVTDDEKGELAGEAGALAYGEAALEAGRTHGISDPLDRTQWVLTSVQALPGLADELANGGEE